MDTMDTGHPYTDVIPNARGQVLAALVQLEAPVTVRALARHAEVSPQHALNLVDELTASGLVHRERAGSAFMVALNRQHLAAEPLINLVSIRRRLVTRIQHELESWPNLVGAWLFGSTARGQGTLDSDIDLLLVADTTTDSGVWTDATWQLQERVRAWTGNDVQLIELTRQSFTELVESSNPLIESLRSDGIPMTPHTRALLRAAP